MTYNISINKQYMTDPCEKFNVEYKKCVNDCYNDAIYYISNKDKEATKITHCKDKCAVPKMYIKECVRRSFLSNFGSKYTHSI